MDKSKSLIEFKTMLITPETAAIMLKSSAGNPRYDKQDKVNERTVEKYASDMKAGRWQLSPEPIAFNESGELVNGHHRLSAVIRSGCTVELCVAYNVPNETTVFDRGLVRTRSQLLKFSYGTSKTLSSGQVISASRLLLAYKKGETNLRRSNEEVTDSELADFILQNRDDLEFCANSVKTSGHGSAKSLMENGSCIHALFCALKTGVPNETIKKFADVVRTGIYDDCDQTAAVMARNYLLAKKAHDFETLVKRSEYVQTCLLDFVRGVPRRTAYRKTEAYFTQKLISQWKNGLEQEVNP